MTAEDQKSACPCKLALPTEAPAQGISRRNLLLKVGAGLNGIAAALIGVPLLGYVLSSFTKSSPNSWISLGPLDRFPQGETRLAVYRNPVSKPWDGDTAAGAVLGAPDRLSGVPGFRDQLYPSGLPGSLVSGISIVHVSVPRGRVL